MIKHWLVGIILISGSLLGLTAFITNIIVAYPQWRFLQIEVVVEWFKTLQMIQPFHRLASVYLVTIDLSMVTTGLFMVTFFTAAEGLYRKIQKNLPRNTEFFPFKPSYKIVYVQLGLLGTLWGFIIAFREVSPEDPSTMLLALGTALWSTFSAIFLAFVVCPLFFEKWIFGYVLGMNKERKKWAVSKKPVKKEIEEIAKSFTCLSIEMNAASDELKDFKNDIRDFSSTQEAICQITHNKEDLETLKNKKIPGIENTIRAAENKNSSIQEKINTQNTLFEKKFEKLENRIKTTEKDLEQIKNQYRILQKIKVLINSD